MLTLKVGDRVTRNHPKAKERGTVIRVIENRILDSAGSRQRVVCRWDSGFIWGGSTAYLQLVEEGEDR
jgi:hypothetical protein